jgi:hypothetical protein
MRLFIYILISFLHWHVINGQSLKLKSFYHGRTMANTDVSMDSIIYEIMFEDGKDDTVSVVRFDNPLGLQPLIISSKLPVPTDSLGHQSIKLSGEQFENFLWLVDKVDCKFYSRKFDGVLLRVTYRYHGKVKQYYVTNRIITTGYLLLIEKQLRNDSDPSILQTFYKFVSGTRLIKSVRGKMVWIEAE